MRKKDGIMLMLEVLMFTLIVLGVFWAKPTIVNNNYYLQLSKDVTNTPVDYRVNQQLEIYKKELREEYNNTVQDLNTKFNSLITVLGIAVMVWVGLNISSLIDRRDLDKLIAREKELEIQLETKSKEVNEMTSRVTKLNEKIEEIDRKIFNNECDLIIASEYLTAGDFVNRRNSSGSELRVCKADASANKPADGFVLEDVTSGATATVYRRLQLNTQKTGMKAGAIQFLSTTTPGGTQETVPEGSGKLLQNLGIAQSATELIFDPQPPITLA